MSRKNKTLIIAFGFLALLGAGYYGAMAWNKKKAQSTSSSFTPPVILGNLDSSELVRIEVPGIMLEKNNGTWELVYYDGKIPPGGFDLDQRQIQILTYSLASLWIDRVVEEEPEDLSLFGLDNPSARAVVTDSSGRKAEYFLGGSTPSRTSYYIMEAGDTRVCSISAYSAVFMQIPIDHIRQRTLFPDFELWALSSFRLEKDGSRIEIVPKPESALPHLVSSFSSYIFTSPYIFSRGVNGEALNNLISPFSNLTIEDFIDDEPSSLAPYGLDRPVRIFIEAGGHSLDLLIGSRTNGSHFAKLAGAANIFTLGGLENVVNVKPFSLLDKLALLLNIDSVDQLLITGGEKNLAADLRGAADDRIFFLNGRKVEDSSFRNFYQSVIGLVMDAEYPKDSAPNPEDQAGISIEYRLNTPPGELASIWLLPYNRDFYALRQGGATEFLISRNQIRGIFDIAEKLVYE